MIDKNHLKNAFGETLRNAGFVKKSDTWYRSGTDAIIVLNLQKSDHGNYFYLNLGISLKALSDELFPKVNHCHIQIGADSLVGDDLPFLSRALDLDEGNEEDLNRFIVMMNDRILPLTSEFLCLNQLREHYKKSTFKGALLFWQARELLERTQQTGQQTGGTQTGRYP